MKKPLILFLVGVTISAIACSSDPFSSEEEENPYSGITETRETSPEPIGIVDPDDWRPFSGIQLPDNGGPIPGVTGVSPAFPNPTSGQQRTLFFS